MTVGADEEKPLGHLVVHRSEELTVPIFDQLFVGRECAGVDDRRRLVLVDKHISRRHFEIRLVEDLELAVVIDTSTNGTLLNDNPLTRAVAHPIKSGDRLEICDISMTFLSDTFTTISRQVPTVTQAQISQADMVMVVGDIVSYSTISQLIDSKVLAENLHTLWWALDEVLRAHHGTLSSYAGDALYAVWDLRTHPRAHALAVDFALAADRRVAEMGSSLALRDDSGRPIRMGWSVVQGSAAQAAMARSVASVLGDSTNLAFRLAGLAGRAGRSAVYATEKVYRAIRDAEAQADRYVWGEPERVTVKGRQGEEVVLPVQARRAATAT